MKHNKIIQDYCQPWPPLLLASSWTQMMTRLWRPCWQIESQIMNNELKFGRCLRMTCRKCLKQATVVLRRCNWLQSRRCIWSLERSSLPFQADYKITRRQSRHFALSGLAKQLHKLHRHIAVMTDCQRLNHKWHAMDVSLASC